MSNTDVSSQIARFAADLSWDQIPESTRHAARRTFANAIGLASHAAQHAAVESAAAALDSVGVVGAQPVLGRAATTSPVGSALLHGIAMHVEDFDDTHLRTVLHPGAPTVAAVLAAATMTDSRGQDVLEAITAGIEVASRVGNGICPDHFDRGWHVTGTMGHLGAAVTVSRLLGLDENAMLHAIGLAATQAAGTTEQLGSMTKPLHPGKAAADGLEAAVLAAAKVAGPSHPLEGRHGLAVLMSSGLDEAAMLEGLGTTWEIEQNAFKPYSCGIVSHPVIDAAIGMRSELAGASIESVDVTVRPVVLDVMGVSEPKDGLQSKFSVYHCFAVGLLDGAAGPDQYSDERALDPRVVELRRKVTAHLDPDMPKDACHVDVTLTDGRHLQHHVEHASGSVDKPMTDDQLRDKFLLLATPRLGERSAALWDAAWHVDELDSLDPLFAASWKEVRA
jgi:2-methylcitrate dehydratase PrpD